MVNMQMSKEEAQEVTEPKAEDGPRYPWGLCINLDDDALAKLGFSSPPAVGTVLTITARVEVTSASQYQTQGQEAESSSSWQITDMEASAASTTGDAKSFYSRSAMTD